MSKNKKIRTKGKVQFRMYFQKFEEGDRVSIVKEKSIPSNFPERIQGRVGEINGKRGRSYFVRIKESTKEKNFLIEPIHLRKINYSKDK